MSDDSNTPPSPDGKDPKNGRFLPGNKFWLARASCGPNCKFDDPADLWAACCEYFEWNDKNPLHAAKIGFYEGTAVKVAEPMMRAMSIFGLCQFLGIVSDTWYEWKKSRPDLSGIIQSSEEIIKRQKFEGASAGLLSHNIIARDLGLADKMMNQMQVMDKDGNPTDHPGTGVMDLLTNALAKVETQS